MHRALSAALRIAGYVAARAATTVLTFVITALFGSSDDELDMSALVEAIRSPGATIVPPRPRPGTKPDSRSRSSRRRVGRPRSVR